MNSFSSSLIRFSFLCFLVVIWVGSILTNRAIGQTADDETKLVKIPINIDESLVAWKGTEMWESSEHEGIVTLNEGYLTYNNRQIIGGKFVADMNSIAITDIPKHERVARRNLRNHLKSQDFFYVEKYPTAEFQIIKTELLKDDSLKVWGDLSIRDVSKTISFTASQRSDETDRTEFHAAFKINRFRWNISYQGSYWDRITSILDNTFVDADIQFSVTLIIFRPE